MVSLQLKKPNKLQAGDKVATVSLSWGGAGEKDLLWRYELGKKRLQEQFGLQVVEMKHTLNGAEFLYKNPQKRAEDLMAAFLDPTIKGIISCIGGDDSIRLLPYVDFSIIRNNPKVFLGYSDSTIAHLMCFKSELTSFYGPSVLAEFAENNEMFSYTSHLFQKTLFYDKPVGEITVSKTWTGEYLPWTIENAKTQKKLIDNSHYEFLQGNGVVQGRLFGGCLEVLEMAKGTCLWPNNEQLKGAILFFETSEDMPDPRFFTYWLRNYAIQGILQNASAVLFGKPYQEKHYDAYKFAIQKVMKEFSLTHIPVVMNMTFGHNQPMCTIPYGVLAQIDCNKKSFSLLESAVV